MLFLFLLAKFVVFLMYLRPLSLSEIDSVAVQQSKHVTLISLTTQ